MQVTSEAYFRQELIDRRHRLDQALASSAQKTQLLDLLAAVDSALHRLEEGSFGICEVCHDPIEEDRLRADPLLRVCIDHLTLAQRRALEDDLALASRVQQKLLPEPDLSLAGWQVTHQFNPAGAVSGDYYDLIRGEEGEGFYFFLGDVSGKGFSASLMMSHLHAMFRSLTSEGPALEQLMQRANHLFCESTISSQYATLVAGRVGRGGEIELASAGHCPVLVVRRSGTTRIDPTGLPIGLFCESRYTVEKLELAPGESLVLFTDGITEARDSSEQEYGLDRLARLVERHAGEQASGLLAAFRSDFDTFRAGTPKHDDVTLLVVRRSG